MQRPEQQPVGFLKLNVWGVTISSALTALIVVILSLPLHLMHQREMFGERAMGGGVYGAPGMMPHPAVGGGVAVTFVLVALLVVLVYGGVGGAIFAAIYNAILNRR